MSFETELAKFEAYARSKLDAFIKGMREDAKADPEEYEDLNADEIINWYVESFF